MATIVFKKETKGISITRDGQKTSYSANVFFRGTASGFTATQASISVLPFGTQPISIYSVDTVNDTITVNVTPFSGDADDLIDSLRTNVFIADV